MSKKTIKIEIEGCDGSSKTTSLKYLVQQATDMGLKVVETREVGNPHVPICVKLRELVLSPDSGLSGEAMEAIFTAMRFENDKWLNALTAGPDAPDLVFSDRGALSHLAYTDHNVSEAFSEIFYINSVLELTNVPDVVIYFSVDTDTALKRRQARGSGMDVIEMKGVEYQEKVRQSFEKYISQISIPVYTIDANQDIAGVRAQLDEVLAHIVSGNKTEAVVE